MKEFEAILKCINDKLRDDEILLEHYREEKSKDEKRILELESKVDDLELALCDETQKNNELTSEKENLIAYIDDLCGQITGLKKTIEALNKKINELQNF